MRRECVRLAGTRARSRGPTCEQIVLSFTTASLRPCALEADLGRVAGLARVQLLDLTGDRARTATEFCISIYHQIMSRDDPWQQ